MAFGAGCLARSRYERDCLVTEKYRIASEKIHGQGKTIVFLTDLHNKEFGEENSRLLETVRKVKPDAVLFGGDGMVAKRGNSDVRIPLALLTELAKEFPVYCGNGNHESRMLWKSEIYGETYENYRTALENAGIRYLSNEAADLDSDIRVYGLDLPKIAYLPRSGEIPEGLLKETMESRTLKSSVFFWPILRCFLRSMRRGERISHFPDIFMAEPSGFRLWAES